MKLENVNELKNGIEIENYNSNKKWRDLCRKRNQTSDQKHIPNGKTTQPNRRDCENEIQYRLKQTQSQIGIGKISLRENWINNKKFNKHY